jgi:hypothetical protein
MAYSFAGVTRFQVADDVSVQASRDDELNAVISHALEQPFTVRIDEVDVRQHQRHLRGRTRAHDGAPVLFEQRHPVAAEHSMEVESVAVSLPIGDHP